MKHYISPMPGRAGLRDLHTGAGEAQVTAGAVAILDLSESGCLIEIGQSFEIDVSQIGEITLNPPKRCKIVWSSGKLIRLSFAEPLTPAEYEAFARSPSLKLTADDPDQVPLLDRQTLELARAITGDRDPVVSDTLPLGVRVAIISGLSLVLWSLIGIAVWVVFR